VAVRCFGVFAGADNGVVFGDVDLDDFDGAREVLGVETLERCVAFFDGAGAEEDVPGWCGSGEELAGELEAYAAVCWSWVSVWSGNYVRFGGM
jgi:hypothetical protein